MSNIKRQKIKKKLKSVRINNFSNYCQNEHKTLFFFQNFKRENELLSKIVELWFNVFYDNSKS